ncbi:hypothetical protein GCM10011312_13770 [Planktosalinus lacus]|uniref:Uncharacterized protein n=2 Tax=Planktosalinus lacus TaxID=1526573 RepID=A0A8J2VAF6_9FLAO|nr:hypothetical protein GCM10011312_13770 [Planktosalinus lacus]
MIVFISCKEDKSEKNAEETTETETVKNETQNSTPNNNGDVAVNPAHGQPGHRCDIPVGAPLNGSSKEQTIKSTQSPVIKNSGNVPVNSNNTSTGENVNPAHGQPGHRCDIPVGAPLD